MLQNSVKYCKIEQKILKSAKKIEKYNIKQNSEKNWKILQNYAKNYKIVLFHSDFPLFLIFIKILHTDEQFSNHLKFQWQFKVSKSEVWMIIVYEITEKYVKSK